MLPLPGKSFWNFWKTSEKKGVIKNGKSAKSVTCFLGGFSVFLYVVSETGRFPVRPSGGSDYRSAIPAASACSSVDWGQREH